MFHHLRLATTDRFTQRSGRLLPQQMGSSHTHPEVWVATPTADGVIPHSPRGLGGYSHSRWGHPTLTQRSGWLLPQQMGSSHTHPEVWVATPTADGVIPHSPRGLGATPTADGVIPHSPRGLGGYSHSIWGHLSLQQTADTASGVDLAVVPMV